VVGLGVGGGGVEAALPIDGSIGVESSPKYAIQIRHPLVQVSVLVVGSPLAAAGGVVTGSGESAWLLVESGGDYPPIFLSMASASCTVCSELFMMLRPASRIRRSLSRCGWIVGDS
jgi:hypothetical protein